MEWSEIAARIGGMLAKKYTDLQPADIDDLTQNVLERLARSEEFARILRKGVAKRIKAFMRTTTGRAAADFFRKLAAERSRRDGRPVDAGEFYERTVDHRVTDPEKIASMRELLRYVRDATHSDDFTDRDRGLIYEGAIRASHADKSAPEEPAGTGANRTARHRAVKKLRKKMVKRGVPLGELAFSGARLLLTLLVAMIVFTPVGSCCGCVGTDEGGASVIMTATADSTAQADVRGPVSVERYASIGIEYTDGGAHYASIGVEGTDGAAYCASIGVEDTDGITRYSSIGVEQRPESATA